MFRAPLSFFLIGICLALMLTSARAEISRNLPAEMGAALWLKADERLELDTEGNGTVVSKWGSKVGNLTATQSLNESARIEGNQTTPNNKYAIFFPQGNATGGYGYFEIPSNFNLKNSTVLVSLKYEGASYAPRVLSFSANGTENDAQSKDALALMFYRDSPNRFRVESEMSGPDDPKGALSPSYSSGNWTVLSYRIDENGNMTVSLNGTAGNQTSNPNMAERNTSGKTRIGLGNKFSRDAQNLANAHIYEILIFNKYLDTGNYTNAQNYMRESMGGASVEIVLPPSASFLNREQLLSQSILSGGNASSNGAAVAGNFTWSDDSEIVTQSGNHSVIFEPTLAKYTSLELKVYVTVNPELNTSINSLSFRTRNGTASPSKSVSISGTNLISDIIINTDNATGFELSTDNSTFGSNATIPVGVSGNASTSLYVRLAGNQTSSGNKTAALNVPSGDQNKTVVLQGLVVEVSDLYIEVTPEDLTLPVTTAGTPSASANFTVTAYNLSGNVTANATTGLEIALGNGTYAQTLEIPSTGGNVTTALNLRVAASASAGALSGSVLLTSGKQKLKKKPKKKKKSVFTFPQVVAASGTTWITAGGNVVSEQDRAQSNTSK